METDLATGAMWYGAFVASTVCHEAAHAWSALRLGDDTAARGGQNTLNPIPHIRREPIGMIVVPLISWVSSGWIIGWASAPYNRQWAQEHPRKAAVMALAGPGTNLLIATVAALCIRLGYEWGVLGEPSFTGMSDIATTGHGGPLEFVAKLLGILFSLNLLLCLFNLVPVPPLDGSSAPLLFLPPAAGRSYADLIRHPMFRMAGLFVAWKVFPLFFPSILRAAIRLVYA
ncbi:MAG TPA: site-2 protease family protein [Opitutaceae bacterium]|jgi:Zn-dependent protease|nr:site-2 protease family protein [Opitutaceae bacterium]